MPQFIIGNNYAFLFTDDPYYCGLRARIPNFVKSRKKKLEEKAKKDAQSSPAQNQLQPHPGQQRILPAPTLNSMSGVQGGVTSTNPLWWHSRLYSDLGPLGSMISILIPYFYPILLMNHYTLNEKYCIMFVIGLAPDGQSTNFQRNPVTSMMPYITGTLIETIIYSLLVIIRSISIIKITFRHIYNG